MRWDAGNDYLSGALATTLLSAALIHRILSWRIRESHAVARQVRCANNEKEIGLALSNFELHRGSVPRAITDERGRPLLSWRVAILPFLGHDELYRRFRVDEPWDSPHNLALLPIMPAFYACPSLPGCDRTRTPHMMLNYYTDDLQFSSCFSTAERWPAAAIRVAEAALPVVWTKPEELVLTGDGSCPSLGVRHFGGSNALLGDGSVHLVKIGSLAFQEGRRTAER